ncbi:DUF3883 domain-containing protein [Schlesneria sp. T3-172]|uniref:DUF3883 domain-containing protein n=1 Tax=Schlesneria TaxID=656899 RepID=UPI002EFB79F0
MDLKKESQTAKAWTAKEVRLLVADYFDMLQSELHGNPYNKAEHCRALAPSLSARTKNAIEFKHQNVSAVLVELGVPYIEGYKPLRNYQSILASEVEAYLDQRPNLLQEMAVAPTLNPTESPVISSRSLKDVIIDPPEKIFTPNANSKPWLSRKTRRIDFAERDAANQLLGKLGEQFVFDLERHRLKLVGRDDLAQKVVWASRDNGDGLGFDIISFDETDDSERLVEVKATGLGKFFPFYVTSNEVRCSEDRSHQYQLFRVFDFVRSPKLFILNGSLRQTCQLEPVLYRAGV